MRISFVNILRAQGFDVLTAWEANQIGKDDREQLLFAYKQKRVLFSHNIVDFIKIHKDFLRNNNNHSGILISPQRKYSALHQARLVKLISQKLDIRSIRNNLFFISNWDK
jgi:hypothetical protein